MRVFVGGARGAGWVIAGVVACSSSTKMFPPLDEADGGADAGTPPARGGTAGTGAGALGGSSGAAASVSGAGNGSSAGGAGNSGGNAGSAVAGRGAEAGTGGRGETGGAGNVENAGMGGACEGTSDSCGGAVCAAVKHVEIPLDLFGDVRDQPTVVRMGDRFALYASERMVKNGGADVAFVSWDGVDAHDHFELDDPCPDDVCTTTLGAAAVATASGSPQLFIPDRGSAVAMTTYPVRVVAWDGGQASPAITSLFESIIESQTVSELATSKNGSRAVFALGHGGGSINIAELGPDAELVVPPTTMTVPSGGWDCLDVAPTTEAGAISVVAGGVGDTEVAWLLRELDADGNVVLEVNASVPAGAALGYTGCPSIVESPLGFHAVWTNLDQESIMATVLRESAPATPPTLTTFPAVSGVMVGGRSDMLVFRVQTDEGRIGFRGIDQNGSSVAKLYVLPVLPVPTAEHQRSIPMLLSVEGSSLYVSYELENTRVIEQVVCD